MLEQTRPDLCRALGACALLVLGACARTPVALPSELEITAVPSQGATCAVAGELQLEGIDAPAQLRVSGAELCSATAVRRELPPGLYRLSWRSAAQSEALGLPAPSPLRGPAMLSVLPGRATRLRLQLEPTAEEPAVMAGRLPAGQVEHSTCSLGSPGAGAS
jgi:hypothetical protein